MGWKFEAKTDAFQRAVEAKVRRNQQIIDTEARRIIESADADMNKATSKFSNALDKSIVKQGPGHYQLVTTDRRWVWLNAGTRPHVILPNNPGGALIFPWARSKRPGLHIAKTRPEQLSAGAGNGDSYRGGSSRHHSLGVYHPGYRGRNWTKILYRKYLKEARRRIKAALRGR